MIAIPTNQPRLRHLLSGLRPASELLLVLTISLGVWAQTSQAPTFGSVPSGPASRELVHLKLRDAINMALRYNLGEIESGENARSARGERLHALSGLLPQVSAGAAENVEQFNSATLGIKIPLIARVIGPFSFSEAAASATQTLFSFTSIQRFRAARTAEQAAQLERTPRIKRISRTPRPMIFNNLCDLNYLQIDGGERVPPEEPFFSAFGPSSSPSHQPLSEPTGSNPAHGGVTAAHQSRDKAVFFPLTCVVGRDHSENPN